MGFYGPVDTKGLKANATFRYTGFGGAKGVLSVCVSGEAQRFTYGFTLVRDDKFVGGIKLNLMGWSGPIREGYAPFETEQGMDLPGDPPAKLVLASATETIEVPVERLPATKAEIQTALPAPLMGSGSSDKLDFNEAYQAALKNLVTQGRFTLLESKQLELYRQTLTYMGLVLGAPTFRLEVTLMAPEAPTKR